MKENMRNPNPAMENDRCTSHATSQTFQASYSEDQHLLTGKLLLEPHGACCLVFLTVGFLLCMEQRPQELLLHLLSV